MFAGALHREERALIDFYAAGGPKLSLDDSSLMDIGACIVDGHDLAPGAAVPDDGDARISHSVQGFLFTCGPDHIRHPAPMGEAFPDKRYPLHGSFSQIPRAYSGLVLKTAMRNVAPTSILSPQRDVMPGLNDIGRSMVRPGRCISRTGWSTPAMSRCRRF